jgi:hypothetical protein
MTEKTTDDIQASLDKALASIAKLETKNSELITREKAAKALADEAETARDKTAREAAEKSGDIETIKASLIKAHTAELKKLTDTNATYEKRLSELLIDNAVKDAITTNNIMPHFAPAVEAMLKMGVEMKNGEAVKGDMPFTDSITAWMNSADAKHYQSAPANTGSGATGSTAKIGLNNKAPETADEYNAFMKMSAENPAQANGLAESWGRPELKV